MTFIAGAFLFFVVLIKTCNSKIVFFMIQNLIKLQQIEMKYVVMKFILRMLLEMTS